MMMAFDGQVARQQVGASPWASAHSQVPALSESAILLDIDGTLLDLMPRPGDVWVPPGLANTLCDLSERSSGALALVSGRSLLDIDLIFAPERFAAIGGHGAQIRPQRGAELLPGGAPPLDRELKRRLQAIGGISPGILLEDKGYSLALHYRLAPQAQSAIFGAVSLICAELAIAGIELLEGKFVLEIKQAGHTKASGVRELMDLAPFKGRRPLFIGDDITDESVFAIMPEMNGLAFSVGRQAAGVNGHVDAPSDVRNFLTQLLSDGT
jgi:trehalose 6-phosphate phosphatase